MIKDVIEVIMPSDMLKQAVSLQSSENNWQQIT